MPAAADAIVANMTERRLLIKSRENDVCTAIHGERYTSTPGHARAAEFRYTSENCKPAPKPRTGSSSSSVDGRRPVPPARALTSAVFKKMIGVQLRDLDASSFQRMKLIIGVNEFVQSSLPKMLSGGAASAQSQTARARSLLHRFLDGALEAAMSEAQTRGAVKALLKLAGSVQRTT